MTSSKKRRAVSSIVLALLLLSLLLNTGFVDGANAKSISYRETAFLETGAQESSDQNQTTTAIYLPLLTRDYPYVSLFGFEANTIMRTNHTMSEMGLALQPGYARLTKRISWRNLQPNENDPIDWSKLAAFENELRLLQQNRVRPIVTIIDFPYWATIPTARTDGQPSSCAPIRSEKLEAFGQFMRILADRYKAPEYNVHIWEMGNEPDVDPNWLEDPNSPFGCWGDKNDPFYGGRYYGEMLKVVTPQIKSANPKAEVWIGGLLLDSPNSAPEQGKPEYFLKGILEAGAAPYFDVVPYHLYTSYTKQIIDYDLFGNGKWQNLGGGVLGKARFLRQIMSEYGVSKPVFLNEMGFACPNDWTKWDWCVGEGNPPQEFFRLQADYIVRSIPRGMSEGISGFIWYTLDGPGWRYSGLLDHDNKSPKPVYHAYVQLEKMLRALKYHSPVSYGEGIEGYAFGPKGHVEVLWSKTNAVVAVDVPTAGFQAAYDRDGAPLAPQLINGQYRFNVGFSPIYLVRSK